MIYHENLPDILGHESLAEQSKLLIFIYVKFANSLYHCFNYGFYEKNFMKIHFLHKNVVFYTSGKIYLLVNLLQ